MNNIWDVIEEAILTAANKHIPKKKIYNTVNNRRRSQKERQQENSIVKLQRIIKQAKARKGQKVIEEERRELNRKIKDLSKEIGAKLPKIQRQWSSE